MNFHCINFRSMQEYVTLPHLFIRCSYVRGPEGLAEISRIVVYLLPCVLIWDADLALIVAEADMEAVALLELLIEHHNEIVG